ncbi:hypothetical protein AB4Y36_22200 [Paraburkholderia sp. BR10936]|uniref:hypothetical protein n=1 Tax=Paraburkholderia sp. BR10936 TaxID=3236993 RepID=UPI0034D2E157
MNLRAAMWMLSALAAVSAQAQGADGAAAASSTTASLGAPSPASILRGGQVSVTGDNLPSVQTVQLCEDIDQNCDHPHTTPPTETTSKSLKFVVPLDIKPGTYRIGVVATGQKQPTLFTSSPLDVTRAIPTISALSNSTLYPAGLFNHQYTNLTIQGTGFATISEGLVSDKDNKGSIKNGKDDKIVYTMRKYQETNQILINDIPLSKCESQKTRYCLDSYLVNGTDTTITVSGIPTMLSGQVKLAVKVEDAVSQPHELLLSRYPRYAPKAIAAVVVFIVLGGAYLANRKLIAVPQGTPTAKIRRWRTLFIDMDSATYSLSRVQLVIWTFVALFGWVYLSVARSFIQGMVTFSDIPSGLPGVLVVSVGTSVAATGVQSVKGTKSSGPLSPTFSDLYSVGGVIAPERAQFLLWTIVGAAGFIVFTLALDPATIQNLPTLPDGFLQLAGISAFGYVGGKIVRKSGPALKGVKGTVQDPDAPKTVTWTLTGTGLAKNATCAYKQGEETAEPPEKSFGSVEIEAKDADQDGDPTLYKVLTVKTTDTPDDAMPPPTPASGGQAHPVHLFVIINPDGQRAEWSY